MKSATRVILNFVLFQLAWFTCVLAAAAGLPVIGTLAAVFAVFIHLRLSEYLRPELVIIAIAVALGTVWESVVVSAGLMEYSSGNFASGIAPHWIIAMWALFATTLNVSLGWLRDRPLMAMVLGSIGGPLAYFAGFKLDAVEIANLPSALAVQSAGWALLMPVLMRLSKSYNGVSPRRTPMAEIHLAEYGKHA